MKYKHVYLVVFLIGVILSATSSVSQALFGGEDSRESIVGVLIPALVSGEQGTETSEWTFKSAGGEILFASLDAEIYRTRTDENETLIAAAEGDGCTDEGGPGLFYIVVIDPNGEEVCRADKPAPPPGWMRDPRMACVLPVEKSPVTYTLKVGLKTPIEVGQMQENYPFALNVSLRGIALKGMNVQQAIGQSQNGF